MILKILLFLFLVIQCYCSNFDKFRPALEHIQPSAPHDVQVKAVLHLIQRIVPDKANLFTVTVYPFETPERKYQFFKIDTLNGSINLGGSSGVEAATAFNHYLKYYCTSHTSWNDYQLDKDKIVVVKNVNITFPMNDRFRYYQNVCTTSYSLVWWSWEHWEKHIDWIVMNSYNFVLTFTGQEALWDKIYRKFGMTDEEINEHFTGPAFLSWLRMGNIRGWGGPLSKAWHQRSVVLQGKIVQRLRELGVVTVMPAFGGIVPVAFKRLYPSVNMTRVQRWNNFNNTYCCPYFLSPTEPLFQDLQDAFIKEITDAFGTDHVYNCDSFNEVDPASTDLKYLSSVAQHIHSSLVHADNKAVWVLQGWMFHYSKYWDNLDRVKAFLTGVKTGEMIILDLQSEQNPQYDRLHQYYGQPYIWCMLHDFGGTLGMFGSIDILNIKPSATRKADGSNMIGTGLTPEGINQNYIVYDFMSEVAWRKDPIDAKKWVEEFTERRYGANDINIKQAWELLRKSVYSFNGPQRMRGQYALVKTPSWNIETFIWYKPEDLTKGFDLFTSVKNETITKKRTYLYDRIDLTRQVYQVALDNNYKLLQKTFQAKDKVKFNEQVTTFLKFLDQMNEILSHHEGYMLGTWLDMAKKCANDTKEAELFEYNARNQISLWGPRGEINNYATKQWNGVVSDLYKGRWKMFFDYSKDILAKNGTFDQNYIRNEMFSKVEEPFTKSKKIYPSTPKGDSLSELDKYAKYILTTFPYLENSDSSEKMESGDKFIRRRNRLQYKNV